jgi:hypothetical protein
VKKYFETRQRVHVYHLKFLVDEKQTITEAEIVPKYRCTSYIWFQMKSCVMQMDSVNYHNSLTVTMKPTKDAVGYKIIIKYIICNVITFNKSVYNAIS